MKESTAITTQKNCYNIEIKKIIENNNEENKQIKEDISIKLEKNCITQNINEVKKENKNDANDNDLSEDNLNTVFLI